MSEYKKTDYLCEGCRQWKRVKKRESDGKMLCKKCSKNKSLTMELNSQTKTSTEEKKC